MSALETTAARAAAACLFFSLVHDQFFVAEPQASLVFKVTNWLRLNSGIGYRVIGSSGGSEDRQRGTTGSFALQFGGGS